MKKNIFNWLSGFSILIFIGCFTALFFYKSGPNTISLIGYVIILSVIIIVSCLIGLCLGVISLIRKEPARIVTWIFLVINILGSVGMFFYLFGF